MKRTLVLRLTVFAVMVALGVAAGVHTGWSQPPPGKGVCRTKACKDHQTVDYGDCPGANKKCIFTSSADNLIYCDKTTGSCPLVDPVQGNQCTGYCESDPTFTCYSTAVSKCQSPVPG